MAAQDLTTLQTLKDWLPITSTNTSDDATIGRLITATSQDFMRATKRPDLLQADYAEVRLGDGSKRFPLYHWPIVFVQSLIIGGLPYAVAESPDKILPGWFIDQDIDPERISNLWLAGGLVFTDNQPIEIGYTAGYLPTYLPYGPTDGQILLPEDIEQAVIDWCTYRYNERPNVSATDRRSTEGDSLQAPLLDAPPNVLRVIERYTRCLPSLDRRQDERDLRMKRNYQLTAVNRS